MLIENLFELIVIGLALTYSNFARLPMLVVCNILAYTLITTLIQSSLNVYQYPGYEIYYTVGGIYFLIMAVIFHIPRDRIYNAIAAVMCVQAIASGSMLISDAFAPWHVFINDKAIVIECICVWLSTLRNKGCFRER